MNNVVTFSSVLRESRSTLEDLLACITESLSSKDPEKTMDMYAYCGENNKQVGLGCDQAQSMRNLATVVL